MRALTYANLRQRKTKHRLQNGRQLYERELYSECKYKSFRKCFLRIDPNLHSTGCKNTTSENNSVPLEESKWFILKPTSTFRPAYLETKETFQEVSKSLNILTSTRYNFGKSDRPIAKIPETIVTFKLIVSTNPEFELYTFSSLPSEISSKPSAINDVFDTKPVKSLNAEKSVQREDSTTEELNNIIPTTQPTDQLVSTTADILKGLSKVDVHALDLSSEVFSQNYSIPLLAASLSSSTSMIIAIQSFKSSTLSLKSVIRESPSALILTTIKNPSSIEPINSTIEPINSTIEPINSTIEPINSTIEPINSAIEPINLTIEPINLTIEPINSTITIGKSSYFSYFLGSKLLNSPTYSAETTLRWETTVLTNSSNISSLTSTIKQFAVTDLRSSIALLLATTSGATIQNRITGRQGLLKDLPFKKNIKNPEEPLTTTSEKILNTKIVSEPSSLVNSIKSTALPFIVTNTSGQSITTLNATPALKEIFENESPKTTSISTIKNKPLEWSIKTSIIVESTPSFTTNLSTYVSTGSALTKSLTLSEIVAAKTIFPQLTANTTKSPFPVFTTSQQSSLIIKESINNIQNEPTTESNAKVSPTMSSLSISPIMLQTTPKTAPALILNPIMAVLVNRAVSTPTNTTLACIKGKIFSPCLVVDENDPNVKCKSPCQNQLVCVVLLGIGKRGNCLPDNSLPLL